MTEMCDEDGLPVKLNKSQAWRCYCCSCGGREGEERLGRGWIDEAGRAGEGGGAGEASCYLGVRIDAQRNRCALG